MSIGNAPPLERKACRAGGGVASVDRRVPLVGISHLILALVGWQIAQPHGIGAQEASPTAAAADVPLPEECRIAPKSEDDLLGLVSVAYAGAGTPSSQPAGPVVIEDRYADADITIEGTPWVVNGYVTDVPPATMADTETANSVMATLRELAACHNAGDIQRWFALHTDAWIEAYFAFWAEPDEDGQPRYPESVWAQLLATPPQEEAPEAWESTPELIGAWSLPDGRVAALIVPGPSVADLDSPVLGLPPEFYLFAQVGERWLVDVDVSLNGFAADDGSGTPSLSIPAGPEA